MLVRIACRAIVDESALPKEAYFRQTASSHKQAIAIENKIIDVFHCSHDMHSNGDNERVLQATTGLTKTQLQRLSDQRSLMPLLTAALKLHCLPDEVTTVVKDPYTKSPAVICTEVKRANMKQAQEVYRQEDEQFWREANPYLTIQFAQPADYLHVSRWKVGWDRFIDTGTGLIRATEECVPNPLRPGS